MIDKWGCTKGEYLMRIRRARARLSESDKAFIDQYAICLQEIVRAGFVGDDRAYNRTQALDFLAQIGILLSAGELKNKHD
jgi:hypothetical protein